MVLSWTKKLSWKANVEMRVKKALNAYYICRKTFGSKWGLKPKIVHWMYTSIVRPILTYGCIVWWPAVDKVTYFKKLKKVQRLACIGITGSLRTTPTASLEVMLNILPIDLFCKATAAKSALRLKESGCFRTRNYGHSTIFNNISLDVTNVTTDYTSPVSLLERNFEIRFPKRVEWESGNNPFDSDFHVIYTDGSKMNTGVGCGIYSEHFGIEKSFKLDDNCSIFQAEVLAIHNALLHLVELNIYNAKVAICIDSQAAIKALYSFTIKSKLVLKCRHTLSLLSENNNILLCWVPGHSDIQGNERVDELAKLGCDSSRMADEIYPPLQYYKNVIDTKMSILSQQRWELLPGHRVSKATLPKVDIKRTNTLLSLNRKDLSLISGIYTGHCLIGIHAIRLGLPGNEECRSCGAIDSTESIEHLFCECDTFWHKRFMHLNKYFLDGLHELTLFTPGQLLGFIKSTNWFIRR